MNRFLLDNPLTQAMMFYPSSARYGTSRLADVHDGTITADDGTAIGYRLYRNPTAEAVLLAFHGNGETAADYDDIVPVFREMGLTFMVADYRGYGWSSGTPRGSKVLSDAEAVMNALLDVWFEHDIGTMPLFMLGRSLGGAPAIHLTYTYPEQVRGLIIESTFAHAPLLLQDLGLPKALLRRMPSLFGNAQKITQIISPLLVIHGEEDKVIPIEHGQMLYDAATMPHKSFLRVPNAGHNNLVATATTAYITTISDFIQQIL